MKFILCRAALLTILLLVISCSVNSKNAYNTNINLESGRWILINLNGQEVVKQNSELPIYLEFNVIDQKLTGFAGCNRIFGAYSAIGNAITFSRVSSTKTICPDASLESTFLTNLQLINHYQIDNEKLLLYNHTNLLATLRLLTD